ncbi:hypothetical protein [Lutimonas vermicola]|uniref:Uncharacterized protein n=1 Tax=Lutimonas vermicola TaxID=414288 RepID=A0ABU9KXA9_9FLAO
MKRPHPSFTSHFSLETTGITAVILNAIHFENEKPLSVFSFSLLTSNNRDYSVILNALHFENDLKADPPVVGSLLLFGPPLQN